MKARSSPTRSSLSIYKGLNDANITRIGSGDFINFGNTCLTTIGTTGSGAKGG